MASRAFHPHGAQSLGHIAAIHAQHRRSYPDEGYYDAVHSQPDDDDETDDDEDMGYIPESSCPPETSAMVGLRAGMLQLSIDERIALMQELCGSLPISKLGRLHDHLNTLIFFDPVTYLPVELVLQIFGFLSADDILNAALVSRAWRERAQDEELWKLNFGREGWEIDTTKFRRHELARQRASLEALCASQNMGSSLQRRGSRKRPRDEAFSENESSRAQDGSDKELSADSDSDESMEEIVSDDEEDQLANVAIQPRMYTTGTEPRVSWPWLYKQRRRLEKNWDAGIYTTFRLPHPAHEEEGHTECVYTIQHNGDTLVSGSRDKSIRVWDLNVHRLKKPPMYGHDASVLCLQFDESPEEDIIVSGGSDNYVIVWKYSTGEIVKKMVAAHNESVLNLRFDDRYLVTCSKDKTIKIWSRKELANNDPIIPRRVLDQFATSPRIEPFTHLDTYGGGGRGGSDHNAAVNAVQIFGDIIISASGDRSVKAWDIQSGKPVKTYSHHTKGIACVQFDGRRVVSGSSDNTVRIFDYHTGAEVACLDSHQNLVRTVQARFGDLRITSDEELFAQSRKADAGFYAALHAGEIQGRYVSRRGPGRNAGSSEPNDIGAIGNRIPPGGGGSRWARIVSGSYDETVIIWKRERRGNWIPKIRLQQGYASNSRVPVQPRPVVPPIPHGAHNNMQAALVAQQHHTTQYVVQNAPHLLAHAQVAHAHILNMTDPGQQAVSQTHLNSSLVQAAALGTLPPGSATSASTQQPPTAANGVAHQPAGPLPPPPPPPPAPTAAPAPAAGATGHHHHQHGHHHHHHHHHHQHAAAAGGGAGGAGAERLRDSNRVFKLQFDTRRIIACSQNKVIVGWDFAAGDRDLEMVGDWSIETV